MTERVAIENDPLLRRAPKGQYALAEPLRAWVTGRRFIVPAGFQTDGASIPPLCWLLVGHPYSPSSLRAAILHDWQCRNPSEHGMSSTRVHRIFYHALRNDGVAWARARAMWLAVHWFGPSFKAP
jgi:hypothetical protein